MFQKILSPGNSLILTYDHLDESGFSEFKEQVEEVGRFYQFKKLRELSRPEKKKRATGLASIVFENARRSVFLRAIPFLMEKNIPFTLMVNPECIGSNRLSLFDEWELYEKFLGSREPVTELKREQLWSDFSKQKQKQISIRAERGALPIDKLDPLFFSATWGQIVDISPASMELGFYLFSHPEQSAVAEAVTFARTQVKREVAVALTPVLFNDPPSVLYRMGFHSLILPIFGEVKPAGSAFELPRFRFQIAVPG